MHLAKIACETKACFEWPATGRELAHPEFSAFDVALTVQDYARDELENRILIGMRRIASHKREAMVKNVDLSL